MYTVHVLLEASSQRSVSFCLIHHEKLSLSLHLPYMDLEERAEVFVTKPPEHSCLLLANDKTGNSDGSNP